MDVYPNPFNPPTTISYQLTEQSDVEMVICNLKSQKIKILQLFPNRSLGTGSVVWDGTDNNNRSVSSGIYFCALQKDGKTITSKKMILLK